MSTCFALPPLDTNHRRIHHPHYQPQQSHIDPYMHLERVPGLWFNDGTMVFRAENTIFRVYHGLLRSKSSVFQDMMSFPQPENGERVEGCPLVQLFDAADDVTHFLKAIFDPEYFLPPPSQAQFPIVASVLRLATKYDVQYLRRRALAHLANSYPMTLEAFDNRLATRTVPFYENAPFAVVNLARELDAPWLLPAALYCCCMLSYATFFSGVPWVNGQELHLSANDKRVCVLGRAALIHAHNRDIYGFLRSEIHQSPPSSPTSVFRSLKFSPKASSSSNSSSSPSSPTVTSPPHSPLSPRPVGTHSRSSSCSSVSSSRSSASSSSPSAPAICPDHQKCERARLAWCDDTLNDEDCYPLARNFGWGQFKEDVCEDCFKESKRRFEDARRALWARLPEIFELGDWDYLKAFQKSAFKS